MASVELEGIGRSFGAVRAVDGLDLRIDDGEFFVLLGPSGAGKTTTLRLVAGLERPDRGRVRMDGEDVTALLPAARDCAFVFQQYSLYPHLSVFDNLAFPLRAPLRRIDPQQVRRRVQEVAEMLHIESKLERRPTELSGGEMQRVAIGRALVRRPRVFLMDEPLSSLDAKLREEMRVELRRLQHDTGATVIYVTHDHVEATTLADRIGILEAGRLQQVGSPLEVYTNPATLAVAQRLGSPSINVLPRAWFNGQVPAAATSVAIRPEDVAIGGDGAEFRIVECSLVKHEVVAERDGVQVHARTLLERPLQPGSSARFAFPAASCLYFDTAGRRLPDTIGRAPGETP
ncbi:ABC transporter ATP-binding protein [Rivibacter subsaxonicus]|uniref:Carbohydrate ABC transporter ATP-binding protein (CUT1 family) n=1 Tax=Rivibacter subsaxonicus TaxID=457575 RepID=A0A4Q7VZI1_9BURK|nr:ABC transporter ATP-binding protein [Rivibacter subsaxonicus]RZU02294.1 carbohydrate ABC transporter ATP-binding protein (CUT1 family) [Rivibacter subsaxonicus]